MSPHDRQSSATSSNSVVAVGGYRFNVYVVVVIDSMSISIEKKWMKRENISKKILNGGGGGGGGGGGSSIQRPSESKNFVKTKEEMKNENEK